jgi:hypothetical protein
MKIEIDWQKPLRMPDLNDEDIQAVLNVLDSDPGLYIFGRVWGGNLNRSM